MERVKQEGKACNSRQEKQVEFPNKKMTKRQIKKLVRQYYAQKYLMM